MRHPRDQSQEVEGTQIDHRIEDTYDDETGCLAGHPVAVPQPKNQVHESPQSPQSRPPDVSGVYANILRSLTALHPDRS